MKLIVAGRRPWETAGRCASPLSQPYPDALIVGGTPEFLGKKIEGPQIILISLALLIHYRKATGDSPLRK